MSNITAFRAIIEKNYPRVSEFIVKHFRDRGIAKTDIDQYIKDVSFPVLHAKTLEMAYDSFKVLRTFVLSGEKKYNTPKIANAFRGYLNRHAVNNTTSHSDLDKVFQVSYITYSLHTVLREMEKKRAKRDECFSFRHVNGYPMYTELHEKGIEFIKGFPGAIPSPKTTNSTMLFSEETIRKIKKLEDSTIVVNGKEFPVNKTILSLQTDFFLELFGKKEFKEGKENHFELKQEGVTQEAFEAYLTFVYEKKIPKKLPMRTLTSLYKLVHFLQDKDCMSALIFKIYRRLDKECFIEVLQLALAMNSSIEDKEKELSSWEKNNQFLLDMVKECLKIIPQAAIDFDPKKLDLGTKLDLLTVALHQDLLKDDGVRKILLEKLVEERDELFFEKICLLGTTNHVVRSLCKSYFARYGDTVDPESAIYKSYTAVLFSQNKGSIQKVMEKVTAQRTV